MPKKKRTRISGSARTAILAEMNSKGLTAKQVAKKYGLSVWTVYGWRKNRTTGGAKRGKKTGRPAKGKAPASSPGLTTGALRDEIRAVLPAILREELARAIAGMLSGKR